MIHHSTEPGFSSQRTDEVLRFFRHLFAGVKNPVGDLYLCIATGKRDPKTGEIPNNRFYNRFYRWPSEQREAVEEALRQADAGHEVYFCVHLLKEKSRKKKAAAPVRTLWSDLDGAPLPEGERAPTAVVESSPGKFHPYWRLGKSLEPKRAEALARALAHEIGADSGWHLGKVLRVPGTFNHKYGELTAVGVKALDPARAIDLASLPKPHSSKEARRSQAEAQEVVGGEPRGYPPVRLRGDALARWHGEEFVTKEDGSIDRSRTLFSIARDLHRANATEQVIAQALQERDRTFARTGRFGDGTKAADRPEWYSQTASNAINGHRPGHQRESVASDRTEGQAMPPPEEEQSEAPEGHVEAGEAAYNLTDMGNAERFARDHKGKAMYCHPWGKWLVWTGTRWEADDQGLAVSLAKDTVRGIYAEAATEEDSDRRGALSKWARQSEAAARIKSMLELARDELAVHPREMDPDPWLLNVANGTLDLSTGQIKDHDPEDLITKIAPHRYDPDAETPTWDSFLSRILPTHELRSFVRRLVGYTSFGVVREDLLVILHGGGDNGKTTLTNAVREALGDYAIAVDPDIIMDRKQQGHTTERMDLFGKRFVSCQETDEGRRLAEARVKSMTSRDPIRGRRMREDPWEFTPSHTTFLSTNHKPEVRGIGHAIWRRLKLIPFDVKIPEAEKDTKLPEKLQDEMGGILAWIVRGCLEYLAHGLNEPDEVTVATDDYRTDMDTVGTFVAERCVTGEGKWATFADLWTEYGEWCQDANEHPGKKRTFGDRLSEHGYEADNGTGNVAIRRDIGLLRGGGEDRESSAES